MTEIEQLQHKVRLLTRLAEVSKVLTSTLELEALLAHLMDAAAEITDCEAASVLLWNPEKSELYFAGTTTSSAALNLIGQPVPLAGSIAGAVLREGGTVQVDDVTQDRRHYAGVDATTDFRTRSIMGVPMISKQQPIGVLEVLNKRQLPWREEDRQYLTALAAQAAVAIENAQLVAALQNANDELSELDKLKNDFIAIASHELRTPLGVILGYSSFLQQKGSNQAINEQLNKVLQSALQLRRIIEDMTNLRYLKQGEADLYRERTGLRDLLAEVLEDTASLCEARGHQLHAELPPADMMAHIDPIRIGMALTNVLNNAIRFTPPGGVIRVTTEKQDGEAWVRISDNGIGLTAAQIERIFEEFYQAEDHMTRRHGGLGIGLSIARALIEAHGGRIWAESPGLSQGATFTIALPLSRQLPVIED
jgi:signal transduction histidine kinase